MLLVSGCDIGVVRQLPLFHLRKVGTCVKVLSEFLDDFRIEDYNLTIPSASPINSTACFIFRPVDDEFIEGNESFVFAPAVTNELDVFDESRYQFSLVIFDDDGKKHCLSTALVER